MGCALASCPVVSCNVIKGGKAGAEQKGIYSLFGAAQISHL